MFLALPASSGAPLYPQVPSPPWCPPCCVPANIHTPSKGKKFLLLLLPWLLPPLLLSSWPAAPPRTAAVPGSEARYQHHSQERESILCNHSPGTGSPWSTIPIQALSTLSSLSLFSGHSPPLPLLSVPPDPSETWSPSPCPGTNFQGKQNGIRHSPGGWPTSRGFRGQQELLKKVTGPTWIASCPYPAGAHPCPCPAPSCCGHGPAPCAADP